MVKVLPEIYICNQRLSGAYFDFTSDNLNCINGKELELKQFFPSERKIG